MRILPFRQPGSRRPVIVADDWSQQDLAIFYRAHRLLLQNGVAIGMDRGQSDAGDPWMVLYDETSQDVFLHVARIERRCLLVCEQFGLRISGPDIPELIEAFETEVLRYVSRQREKQGNVLQHPASRLIMSISALFLLFKLENGEAHAKGAVPDVAEGVGAPRKQEVSAATALRASPVIGRIFDIGDAPAAAAAAIAGAILSVEISRLLIAEQEAAEATDPALARAQGNDLLLQAGAHDGAADPSAPDPLADAVKLAADAPVPPASLAVQLVLPQQVPGQGQAKQQHASAEGGASKEEVAAGETQPVAASRVSEPATSGSDRAAVPPGPSQQMAPEVAATVQSQAVQAAMPLLAELDDDALFSLSSAGAEGFEAGGAVLLQSETLGEVTIADLGRLDGMVVSYQSALTGGALTEKIVEFINLFGQYEVEISNQTVLIEQQDSALLQTDEAGIWTNLMPDGSTIAVVGQLSVLSMTLSLAAA